MIGVIYRFLDSKPLEETHKLKLLHNATQHKSTFKLYDGDFNTLKLIGQALVVTIS